jgi:hypothetical protein
MRVALLLLAAPLAACGDNGGAATFSTQGELTMLDLVGTFYPTGQTPRTHILFTQARLPAAGAGDPLYIDPAWTPTTGCVVLRYDAGGHPPPNADEPVGDLSFTGFATSLFAATSSAAPSAPPVPASLSCTRGVADAYEACRFGDPTGTEAIAGRDPFAVAFPPIPPSKWSGGACDMQSIPDGKGGMTAVCEQHPLPDGSQVTVNLAGAGGYSALVNVTAGTVGGADFGWNPLRIVVGGHPVSSLDALALDGSGDLAVQWSCDPLEMTPTVDHCPKSARPDGSLAMVVLYAVSSANEREGFQLGTRYSVARCLAAVDDPRATIVLPQAGIQALLGSESRTPGAAPPSLLVAVARMNLKPQSSLAHSVDVGAGRGQFALVNFAGAPSLDLSAVVDGGGTD